MTDGSSWPGDVEPVVGFRKKMTLDVEGVIEMEVLQGLFLKRMEQLGAEGKQTPEKHLHWRWSVQPDFSGMPDEQRESIEAQIQELRVNPAFRARLKRRLEEDYPELACLMDENGDEVTPANGAGR
jgi:hypothetical protein